MRGKNFDFFDRILVFVLIFFVFFPLSCSAASDETVIDENKQFQFAEQYFQRGEYYRAIGEYERFIYFFPHSKDVVYARFKIGISYLRGEKYQQAIDAFESLIAKHGGTTYALKGYLGMSDAYLSLKEYESALACLQMLISSAPDKATMDVASYQMGWIYLEMGLPQEAREWFLKISPENQQKYNIEHLSTKLEGSLHLKKKDPVLAGFLAVLPGAGHLYCGRKRDALASLLVNGALIYATCEAFDKDHDVLGGILAFVELGFYTGNIYSAASSAHKYNRAVEAEFLGRLKSLKRLNVSLIRHGQPGSFLVVCRFSF